MTAPTALDLINKRPGKNATQKQRDAYWKLRRAHMNALDKLPVTQEELDRWAPMLRQTWQAIGGNVEQAFVYSNEKLPRGARYVSMVIETTLDCNYPEMHGGMTHEEYEFLGMHASHRPKIKKWLREVLNY
jgi:hypothetical protein